MIIDYRIFLFSRTFLISLQLCLLSNRASFKLFSYKHTNRAAERGGGGQIAPGSGGPKFGMKNWGKVAVKQLQRTRPEIPKKLSTGGRGWKLLLHVRKKIFPKNLWNRGLPCGPAYKHYHDVPVEESLPGRS
jgi:hypothetical protein